MSTAVDNNNRASRDFVLPGKLSPGLFCKQLRRLFPLEIEPREDLERIYLDTFDWGLHAGGGVLLAKRTTGDYSLVWEDRDHGRPLATVLAADVPVWASDIPAGHLKDQLSGLMAMRALLPLVRLRSRVQLIRVLNEDDKTVVRLRLESPVCHDARGRRLGVLNPRLTLVPLKGYDKEAASVAAKLRKAFSLKPAQRSLFDLALSMTGRVPGDYDSSLNLQLRPDMRADEAMRYILRHLLATLEANVAGTKADIDSEFLHDLRVATRRTRSALGQIKGVLPEAVTADFKQRFGWLGQVTGPTRDLDVFILDFPRYRQSLPEDLRADLEPLLDYLQAHQVEAQQALKRRLNSPHFHRLRKDWHAYLDGMLVEGGERGQQAGVPVKQLADRRIWHMYRRVIKDGRAIDALSPPEALHTLRKDCKKLRYLMEFFQSLYPRKRIRSLIKQLKRLLENLGQFQDLEVQADKLRGYSEDLQQQDAANLPTVLAIGALVGDLLQRQQAARAAFAECFSSFDTETNGRSFRQLFKAGGKQ